MVDFVFKINTTDGERELKLLASSLAPEVIDRVLTEYGERWLRARVQQHFEEQPGWPPRKDVTTARIAGGAQTRAVGKLRVKLNKDLRRARKRFGVLETSDGFSKEQQRQSFLASQGRRHKTMPEVIKTRKAAVERREAVLMQLGQLASGIKPEGRSGAKLQERFGRALSKEQSKKLLGRIAQSFKLEVNDGRLTYGSEIGWAGIHNEGGVAGHGAQIPERKFAFLEPVDVEVLVAVLLGEGVNVEVH